MNIFTIGASLIGLSVLFLLIGLEVLIVTGMTDRWEVMPLVIPVTLIANSMSVGIPFLFLSKWQGYAKDALPVFI